MIGDLCQRYEDQNFVNTSYKDKQNSANETCDFWHNRGNLTGQARNAFATVHHLGCSDFFFFFGMPSMIKFRKTDP